MVVYLTEQYRKKRTREHVFANAVAVIRHPSLIEVKVACHVSNTGFASRYFAKEHIVKLKIKDFV